MLIFTQFNVYCEESFHSKNDKIKNRYNSPMEEDKVETAVNNEQNSTSIAGALKSQSSFEGETGSAAKINTKRQSAVRFADQID